MTRLGDHSTTQHARPIQSRSAAQKPYVLDSASHPDSVREYELADVSAQVSLVRQEISGLRRDFNDTLRRLEPAIASIAAELAGLRSSVALLPTKWTIKSTVWAAVLALLAINVALFTAYMAAGLPKDFWLAVFHHFFPQAKLGTGT